MTGFFKSQNKNRRLRSESGQMTFEAVLILLIMASFFTLVHRRIKSQEYLSKIVSGPWGHVKGIIENGVWETDGSRKHPNVFERRASPEPL